MSGSKNIWMNYDRQKIRRDRAPECFFFPHQIEERFGFVVTGNLILGPCTRDVFVEASHILGIEEVT